VNKRVVTSVPRLVRSSYNSFTEVTRVVWFLLWIWTHFPHIHFNFRSAKLFCPAFFKLIHCPTQFLLRTDSPRCICPGQPHSETRMVSRTIPVSISGTYLHSLQKGLLNWYLCQSMFLHIPKTLIGTRKYNQSVCLYVPHPRPMFQLYITPHQCLYSCLGS